MCGICGILGFKPLEKGAERINAMVLSLEHRGPDGGGSLHPAEELYLGHRRLSVIDLSEGGAQPMIDGATGNVIVYNGEIYNFRELAIALQQCGHEVKGNSDTEVVLKAYHAWGRDCLKRFRGIFAFAIWDASRRLLFLGRDQMGVKPLYFSRQEGAFVFASEVRSILSSGLVAREVSMAGLESALCYGSVQEPYTLVEGIQSLPAGVWMELEPNGREVTKRYAVPDFSEMLMPINDIAGLLGSSLEAAVRLQMVSDVPLGVFLSGGIDSAAVAGLMARAGQEVHSFTVVFDDKRFDERESAQATAKRLGTTHHELELTRSSMDASIRSALDDYDQPSIDGLNTWFVAKLVREAGMKVALSGLGGDEVFVGYDYFCRPRRILSLAWLEALLPARLCGLASGLCHSEGGRKFWDIGRFRMSPYFLTRQIFSARLRGELLGIAENVTPNWMHAAFGALEEQAPVDLINRLSYYEMSTYMRSTLLRDADQMGMAHGLEIRVPLLDQVLVGTMMKVSGKSKVDKRIPKHLLVKGAGVPPETYRRAKRGFDLPLENVAREAFFDEIEACFNAPPEPFSMPALTTLLRNFMAGRCPWQRVWTAFSLIHWMNKHLG